MPRYEYRKLEPLPEATRDYDRWVEWLDQQFANKDVTHRSEVVREVLCQLYYGKAWDEASRSRQSGSAGNSNLLSAAVGLHALDPRNSTLEPEYYGDIDAERFAERKPLIWFWMMYDRSPAGLNHALGYRVRAMIGKHVFKHIGKNVKIFHGVEVSYGYNLTIE